MQNNLRDDIIVKTQPLILEGMSKKMKVFLLGGLLYLAGIAVMLIIRPSFMFRNDGTWKEFGIGRNNEQYTWCPFWLFCVFWALVSYIISLVLIRIFVGKSVEAQGQYSITDGHDDTRMPRRIRRGSELPEGYYILSKPVRSGETPSYTYLGPQAA
jgi:hypothetical protein